MVEIKPCRNLKKEREKTFKTWSCEGKCLDLKGQKDWAQKEGKSVVEGGMAYSRQECRGKHHGGYTEQLTAQVKLNHKLRWVVGKDVERKDRASRGCA